MKKKIFFNICVSLLFVFAFSSCSKIFDAATVEKSREEATSKIVFDANGGVWEVDNSSVHIVMGVIGLPLDVNIDNPERRGYVFDRWIPQNGAPKVDNITKVPETDLLYKANWNYDVMEVSLNKKRLPITKSSSETLIFEWEPPEYLPNSAYLKFEKQTGGAASISVKDAKLKKKDSNGTITDVASGEAWAEGYSYYAECEVTISATPNIGDKAKVTAAIKFGDRNLDSSCEVYVTPKLEDIDKVEVNSSDAKFGIFPQDVKADSVIIIGEDENDLLYGEYVTTKHAGQTYYFGDDGNWYAKVKATPSGGATFSNGNAVKNKAFYYFKVKPIEWVVLDGASGNKLLFSKNALDYNVKFYGSVATSKDTKRKLSDGRTIYETNYKYSNVRAYLNGIKNEYLNETGVLTEPTVTDVDWTGKGFVDIAFTETSKGLLKDTSISNNLTSTALAKNPYVLGASDTADNTTDKVFLLSAEEMKNNTTYGFQSNTYAEDTKRQRTPTDYAIAKGCGTKDKKIPYLTRSSFYCTDWDPDQPGKVYDYLADGTLLHIVQANGTYGLGSDNKPVVGNALATVLVYGGYGLVPAIRVNK